MNTESARVARLQRVTTLYARSGTRLDDTDLAILRLLQVDARISVQAIADQIGLSHSGALNRVLDPRPMSLRAPWNSDSPEGQPPPIGCRQSAAPWTRYPIPHPQIPDTPDAENSGPNLRMAAKSALIAA